MRLILYHLLLLIVPLLVLIVQSFARRDAVLNILINQTPLAGDSHTGLLGSWRLATVSH